MNKRDFLKGTAALSLSPAFMPTLGTAAMPAAPQAMALPVPTYVYNSVKRVMKFTRADDNTREMHAYFARG